MLNRLNQLLTTNQQGILCTSDLESADITLEQFRTDIQLLQIQILKSEGQSWLLYSENSYRFLVGLMALLCCNKSIIICANKRASWLIILADQFDMILSDEDLNIAHKSQLSFEQVDNQSKANLLDCLPLITLTGSESITFFTSGSTGEPKQINKQLRCLTNEVATLESAFGSEIPDSLIVSSVSHLHIYGLLVKLLWPLIAGRAWFEPQIEYPEQIVSVAKGTPNIAFVSSPAFLSRLDLALTKVSTKMSTKMIFSSGGPLSFQAAQESLMYFGCVPTEIYGSTETGGIAYRQQATVDSLWTPFKNIEFESKDDMTWITSPHITTQNKLILDDKLEFIDKNKFLLKGRKDRIVKIAEKRISLTEIEQYLENLESIDICKSIIIKGSKDSKGSKENLGCIIVLSELGKKIFSEKGIGKMVKDWKQQMRQCFEPVTIPKKWRVLSEIPVNSQCKVDTVAILAAFDK